MKRCVVPVLSLLIVFFLMATVVSAAAPEKTKSATGKVVAIDPKVDGIVIEVGKGKEALTVGTIIPPDAKLKVAGKNMPVADLTKAVQVGDTVTINYVRTDDLYARLITKK